MQVIHIPPPKPYWTPVRVILGVVITAVMLWITGAIPACLHAIR